MKGSKIVIDYATKNDKREDYLHSSAYAQAQNGEAMGTDAAVTFAERQKLEANRQFIQGFKSSKINAGGNSYQRAKTFTPVKRSLSGAKPAATPSGNSSISSRFSIKPSFKP